MNEQIFIKMSLELNLFFLRIMGEHAALYVLAFPDVNKDLKEEGTFIYRSFTDHLKNGLELALSFGLKMNDDAITKYTLEAEQQTARLTGFPFNSENTVTELNFANFTRCARSVTLANSVRDFNDRSLALTDVIIRYKTKILDHFTNCKLFMNTYPLLIDHTLREAKMFHSLLTKLQKNENPMDSAKEFMTQEVFWNEIMKEHIMFIRGMLDPTEKTLFNITNETAQKYEKLMKTIQANPDLKTFTENSLALTKDVQKFKTQGVEGILKCQISSMIAPLLADHVLREANHFIMILDETSKL